MQKMSLSTSSNKFNSDSQVLKAPIDNNTIPIHYKIIAGIISWLVAATILICVLIYVFKRFKSS